MSHEDVFYAPRPFPEKWTVGEVLYEGRLLGRIPVPDNVDTKDPEGTTGHIGRVVLVDLLKANPAPEGMAPQEWILWVLRGIGVAMTGARDETFEKIVMQRFLRYHGALSGMELLVKLAARKG